MSETFVPSRALDSANSPLQGQNLLANGGFENWNNGIVVPSVGNYTALADKWVSYIGAGSPTITVSRDATVFDTELYSMSYNVTVLGGATEAYAYQIPANVNFLISGKTVTMSVRVKTAIANKVRARIRENDSSYTVSSAHTGDNTWQTLTVTKTLGAAGLANLAVGMFSIDGPTTGQFWVDSAMAVYGSSAVSYMPDIPDIDKVKLGVVSSLQQNPKNILVNGGMEIWQRGASFSSPVNGTYTADKWFIQTAGGSPTYTVSREASIVDGGVYSMKLDLTVVNGVSYIIPRQNIENYIEYRGKTLTLTVRAKTTLTNSFGAGIVDSVTGTYSTSHTGSGNWETLTATRTIDPSATFVTVALYFTPAVGTVYIDSCMLTFGSTPIQYVPEDPQQALDRCMRWYETSYHAYEWIGSPQRYSSSNKVNYVTIPFLTPKVNTPTITTSGSNVGMYHSPTSGNGNVGDTANWPITAAGSLNNFYWYSTRTTDQTTYPNISFEFNWVAECT